MSRNARAQLLLFGVVLIWGTSFVLVKDALRDISPLLFNLLRMSLAFAVLAIVYHRELRHLNWAAIRSGALVGLCLASGYQLQTAGLRLTTPSKSAFLTGMVVVLVPLLSAVPWLRAPGAHAPRWNAWLGAVAAFGGLLLLTMPAPGSTQVAFHGLTFGPHVAIAWGDLLSFGCAIGFALHVLALAHAAPRMPYMQLAVLQIGFMALAMAITLPIFEPHPFLHATRSVFVALAVSALLATAAAFTIQTWAQQFLPATHTALILTLEPVVASAFSFLFLGERLGLRAGCGAGLILLGIGLAELLPQSVLPTAHEVG